MIFVVAGAAKGRRVFWGATLDAPVIIRETRIVADLGHLDAACRSLFRPSRRWKESHAIGGELFGSCKSRFVGNGIRARVILQMSVMSGLREKIRKANTSTSVISKKSA